MHGALASIMLLTAILMLALVAVNYTVNMVGQTMSSLPQTNQIIEIEHSIQNGTYVPYNQTQTEKSTQKLP